MSSELSAEDLHREAVLNEQLRAAERQLEDARAVRPWIVAGLVIGFINGVRHLVDPANVTESWLASVLWFVGHLALGAMVLGAIWGGPKMGRLIILERRLETLQARRAGSSPPVSSAPKRRAAASLGVVANVGSLIAVFVGMHEMRQQAPEAYHALGLADTLRSVAPWAVAGWIGGAVAWTAWQVVKAVFWAGLAVGIALLFAHWAGWI